MPRRLRKDYPGAWHHVMDRGIARRTLFEAGRDVRYFLACLARQVRAGDLEIHAYTVLTTHFHLLARSPRGRLSAAMQRALDAYARWFNRSRRRDGPLFRGRFVNRLVETEGYWATVLRYIDRNPVEAGLVAHPVEYPHGSARHYAEVKGPPWLRRSVVEAWARGGQDRPYDPTDYVRFSERACSPGATWVAERRLRDPVGTAEDPLDDLLRAAPSEVRAWMERKALAADGTTVGRVLVAPSTLHACVERHRAREPGVRLETGRKSWPWWETVEVGALRGFCGLTQEEIVERTGVPRTSVQRRLSAFAAAWRERDAFRDSVARILEEALRIDHGPPKRTSGAGPTVEAPCRVAVPTAPGVRETFRRGRWTP